MADNKKSSSSFWITTDHKKTTTTQKSGGDKSRGDRFTNRSDNRDANKFSSHEPVINESAGPSGSRKK